MPDEPYDFARLLWDKCAEMAIMGSQLQRERNAALDVLDDLLVKAELHWGAPAVNDVPTYVQDLLTIRRRERERDST